MSFCIWLVDKTAHQTASLPGMLVRADYAFYSLAFAATMLALALLQRLVVSFRMTAHAGAILADDMGLGKTLQSITLLWTLLNSGNELLGGKPVAKRVIICCPTSLVSNWDSEIQKWLKVKVPACCAHPTAKIDNVHLT